MRTVCEELSDKILRLNEIIQNHEVMTSMKEIKMILEFAKEKLIELIDVYNISAAVMNG